MDKVQIIRFSDPKMHDPVLICGMPDAGYVGRLAPYHLAKGIGATKLAELYSYFLPAQIMVAENGTGGLPKCEFYFKDDTILLTGDAQAYTPEGQYLLSQSVLRFALEQGCKRVYTLGAYITTSPHGVPSVYGTATSKILMEEMKPFGVEPMNEGNITGMNGLLFGLSKAMGMEGIGLFAETQGNRPDGAAARALIEITSRILKLSPTLDSLSEDLREMERLEGMVLGAESPDDSRRKASEYIT